MEEMVQKCCNLKLILVCCLRCNVISEKLLQRILSIASNKNSVVIDFFGSSGTTAHAVAIENKSDYKGKDYAKCGAILDYRKSRKLIDKLSKGESVCLDMHTESRKDFDIFHTLANLMGWKIKRLFLDSQGIESCEFDNGEIVSKDCLDLHKYPKLKNLIWWE